MKKNKRPMAAVKEILMMVPTNWLLLRVRRKFQTRRNLDDRFDNRVFVFAASGVA